MSIESLFYPRGVAVVGSAAEGKLGWELIRTILDGGYETVFAVNPKAQGAFSAPGVDAVSKIEQLVDLAVIVSPPHTVSAVLEDCGRAGVKAAAIITAGFSEAGNRAGEAELVQVAEQYGIRFIGPNCAGLINTAHRLCAALETHPPAGGVAVVVQSGAVGGVFTAWAKEFGLGVSKFVNYGNGADLNETDFLRYLADDPETRVVALYLESTAGGRELMQALRACAKRKPVVVIKAGRTQSGRRATLSHTGSMAGADEVVTAALRQSGAIRVCTIEEMFDLCTAFTHVPRLQGRRLAIVTNSGGPAVLAADRAEELGLKVAEPGRSVKEKLAAFLPPHCALNNPIDLTVEGTEDDYRHAFLAVAEQADAILALNIAPAYLDSTPLARGVCDAAQRIDRPVVASFLPRQIVGDAVAYLQRRGLPNFATGERAVAALAHIAAHGARRAERQPPPSERRRLPGDGRILEHEAMGWLRENGLPVPEFRFAATRAEAVRGCAAVGYPVAMKVVSPKILHKSDHGGVVLEITDDRAAAAAFETLRGIAEGKDFRGVVVYPMIEDAVEVLLGISRDPQFGPVVAFGLGGIHTETWRDVSLRVAPVERSEAETMIREIRSYPLLQGTRGQEPRDLGALADVLASFSRLPFLYPEIEEVDLNPVFLLPAGLLVGDARVIRREDATV